MRAIGRPEMAEGPRYARNVKRVENEGEIGAAIAAWTGVDARDRGQGTMRSARKRPSNRTNISSLSTTAWKPCRRDFVTFDITSQSQLKT